MSIISKRLIAVVIILLFAAGCHKWDDYKKYQTGGELTYPGKGDTVIINSGDRRIQIDWKLSTDPAVVRYKLYWNDQADSLQGEIPESAIGNTFSITVEDLTEGNYNFTLYAVNAAGDLSAPSVFSGRVYGDSYRSSLLNRPLSEIRYAGGDLILTWGNPDTVNISTQIQYTTITSETEVLVLDPDSSETVITNWKLGTPLYYQSYYKPNSAAIDTFATMGSDSVIVENILVDKSTWKKAPMPTDVDTDAYGSDLSYIWDGSPGGFPQVYHSASGTMPQHFTFDMGAVYSDLTAFSEAGRSDCACHNPDHFQVWGIADTTGAATALPSDDAGWEAESVAKGWTLLTTVTRTDDGIAPFKVELPAGLPPVRFIRIRVLHTVDDHTSESHMSEVSFWYNP